MPRSGKERSAKSSQKTTTESPVLPTEPFGQSFVAVASDKLPSAASPDKLPSAVSADKVSPAASPDNMSVNVQSVPFPTTAVNPQQMTYPGSTYPPFVPAQITAEQRESFENFKQNAAKSTTKSQKKTVGDREIAIPNKARENINNILNQTSEYLYNCDRGSYDKLVELLKGDTFSKNKFVSQVTTLARRVAGLVGAFGVDTLCDSFKIPYQRQITTNFNHENYKCVFKLNSKKKCQDPLLGNKITHLATLKFQFVTILKPEMMSISDTDHLLTILQNIMLVMNTFVLIAKEIEEKLFEDACKPCINVLSKFTSYVSSSQEKSNSKTKSSFPVTTMGGNSQIFQVPNTFSKDYLQALENVQTMTENLNINSFTPSVFTPSIGLAPVRTHVSHEHLNGYLQDPNTPPNSPRTPQNQAVSSPHMVAGHQQMASVPHQVAAQLQQMSSVPQQSFATPQQHVPQGQQGFATYQQSFATPQQQVAYPQGQQQVAYPQQQVPQDQQQMAYAQQQVPQGQQQMAYAQQQVPQGQQQVAYPQQSFVTPQQQASLPQQQVPQGQQQMAYAQGQQMSSVPQQQMSYPQQQQQASFPPQMVPQNPQMVPQDQKSLGVPHQQAPFPYQQGHVQNDVLPAYLTNNSSHHTAHLNDIDSDNSNSDASSDEASDNEETNLSASSP